MSTPAVDEVVTTVPPGTVAFGIQLPVQSQSTIYVDDWERTAGPAELAAVARAAESAGFTYVAVCDHTAIPRRLAGAMGITWYDTMTTLGWLAGITSRVRLLSHVYVAALRHPLRAAKEIATLDVLSGGRAVVGVGAGHIVEELALLGTSLPSDGSRGDAFADRGGALDEAIAGIAAALRDEFPVLPGPRWPAADLAVAPRPVQRPRPPIWVGGSSAPALRRVARLADGWLPQTARRDDMRRQVAQLLDLRAELRGGAPVDIGALPGTFHVGTPIGALPRGTVSGTPQQLADNLAELTAMGCAHLQVRFPSRSCAELCDQLAAFGQDVAPLVPPPART